MAVLLVDVITAVSLIRLAVVSGLFVFRFVSHEPALRLPQTDWKMKGIWFGLFQLILDFMGCVAS